MYMLYVGDRPFVGLNEAQIVTRVALRREKLPFPADCPAPYRTLAERCMAYEPEDRPNFNFEIQDVSNVLTLDFNLVVPPFQLVPLLLPFSTKSFLLYVTCLHFM
jgi:hypothetical protein